MVLLDTHTLIWVAELPELLSARAHEEIASERAVGGVAISDITLWEVAHLASRGRIRVRTPLREFFAEVERRFRVIAVNGAIAERAAQFGRGYPADPADKLIGATAVVNGLKLVTKDEGIKASGEVDCIW